MLTWGDARWNVYEISPFFFQLFYKKTLKENGGGAGGNNPKGTILKNYPKGSFRHRGNKGGVQTKQQTDV